MRFAFVCCALAGVAMAKGPTHRVKRYVLRDVRVEGNATPEETKLLRERIMSTIELMVSENADELVHQEDVVPVLAQHPDLKACFDVRCGAALGDAFKADKVLSIGIERSGVAGKGDWMVRVWHFDTRALKVGASVDLPCRGCSTEDLLGDLAHSLGPALQTEVGQMCTVKVSSKPEGATVMIEGTAVGETPFQHTMTPGRHAIAVEKPGFSRGEDEIDCPPGSMQNVSFALTQGTGTVHHEEPIVTKRSPALKIVGGALIVLGAAGIASGAAELYLDGRGTCDLAPGQKECKLVYDTKLAGEVLVGVGAAGVVAGIVTLVVDAVKSRPAKVSADIRLAPGIAFVGARGSF